MYANDKLYFLSFLVAKYGYVVMVWVMRCKLKCCVGHLKRWLQKQEAKSLLPAAQNIDVMGEALVAIHPVKSGGWKPHMVEQKIGKVKVPDDFVELLMYQSQTINLGQSAFKLHFYRRTKPLLVYATGVLVTNR